MRERFDQEFQALLDPDNPDTRSIWTYITRLIGQFGLSNYGVTTDEILNEVYSRGIRQIVEQGKPIDNPLGWTRLAALNVVRETARRRKRWRQLESLVRLEKPDLIECPEILIGGETIENNLEALYTALEQLTPKDKEILCWRHVEGLSWCEVGERLMLDEQKPQSEATLRQQGYRALSRLRKLFHASKRGDPILV